MLTSWLNASLTAVYRQSFPLKHPLHVKTARTLIHVLKWHNKMILLIKSKLKMRIQRFSRGCLFHLLCRTESWLSHYWIIAVQPVAEVIVFNCFKGALWRSWPAASLWSTSRTDLQVAVISQERQRQRSKHPINYAEFLKMYTNVNTSNMSFASVVVERKCIQLAM